MTSYETRVAIAAEEKQRELAAKVAQATWEQLESQLDADIAAIISQTPSKASADAESALDMQYMKTRQQFLVCCLKVGLEVL